MAYAAVASLLQTIDILLDHHQRSISPQFRNQIISIGEHTCFLRSFIEGSSDRVNNWEETIRQVTVSAEDIIELLFSDSLLESIVGSSKPGFEKGKCETDYSLDELEKVREEMESIVSRVKGGRRIETGDGSDDEVMEIISRLVGGSSSLEIIAICGSGGMGKTTLAANAHTHPLIVEHFDIRVSSRVTSNYDRIRIASFLLLSMNPRNAKITAKSEDELIQSVHRNLGGKRYLILLDDVWSQEALDGLKLMLPDNGNGSRIIFTTRSFDLANSAHHVHEMRFLDEDKTWNLLREQIFKGDPCPFQLESMGKTIASSCGGHPLSIAMVYGILDSSDQTEAAWGDVLENIKIASEEDGDKVDEILYLSYMYLPHHLRPCFLYMGIFPEDRAIYVSRLVKLWVAEGFMNESVYKSLEETGEEYVEDLVRRRLVLVYKRKRNGRIKSVRVHDLIRGMCIRQAHIDNFNFHFDNHTPRLEVNEIMKSCRRVSYLNDSKDFLRGVHGSTIRTLCLYSKYNGKLDLRCWIGNVRLLRILDLLYAYNYQLSGQVFELFHLRYLAIHWEFNIPEVISNLVNLQTLIILHIEKGGIFDELPEGIWRMLQLRHLRIICFKFPSVKGPTSVLGNLQTLSTVVDFVCTRENLKIIASLKKLSLLYTKKLRDVVENYELQNLAYLPHLEILKIETNSSLGEEHKMSCAFPATLKELSLHGMQLSWEDMKMVALLPNLEVLKLRNHACVGDTWETSEGGFSQLTYLLIEESILQHWIIESSHFPMLRWLVLVRCSSLLEIPYEIAEIPTLVLIELDDTNQALLRSAKRIQKERQSLGYDSLDICAL